jgi:hypothetical protein
MVSIGQVPKVSEFMFFTVLMKLLRFILADDVKREIQTKSSVPGQTFGHHGLEIPHRSILIPLGNSFQMNGKNS